MDTTPAPRLSVGLPVYNGARYLRQALDSILTQTYEDFELIISDNASTDDTELICKEYVARDRRIRYERQPENLGAAANYRRTFDLATGELFKWATHDDICRPQFFERCIDVYSNAPASTIAVVHPRTVLIDEAGHRIRDDVDDLAHDSDDPIARFSHILRHVMAANSVSGVFPRRLLATTNLIAPHEAGDWILLAEIVLRGKIICVDDVLFERRIHDEASLRAIILRGGGKRDVVAWWDTRRVRLRSLIPFDIRTSYALFKAVAQAPLSGPQRSRAWLAIPQVYWMRLVRFRVGRLKRRLSGQSLKVPAIIPRDHQ